MPWLTTDDEDSPDSDGDEDNPDPDIPEDYEKDSGTDPEEDAGGEDTPIPESRCERHDFIPFGCNKVDILVVVDNSASMEEEQARLPDSFRSLINALVSPPEEWQEQGVEAVENIRIAVVSTDMGVDNVYWGFCDSPLPGGDKGKFMHTGHGTGCESSYPQWIESTWRKPNPDLADDFACIATLGIEGCGFEMQLYAAQHALQRKDQKAFLRDNSLLVIVVVSDESDCTAEPGSVFWDHYMDPYDPGMNMYCYDHSTDLDPVQKIANDLKRKGSDSGIVYGGTVVFAAIVGVPVIDDCQGDGLSLESCLSYPEMQIVEWTDELGRVIPRPACESGTMSPVGIPDTRASPGRRFVELAQEFEEHGYVYSICNEDWTDPMISVAKRIAENITAASFDEQLVWNSQTRTSGCRVIFRSNNQNSCPDGLEDLGTAFDKESGSAKLYRLCRLEAIPHDRQCAVEEDIELDGRVGWIYCEADESVQEKNPNYTDYNILLTTEAIRRTAEGGKLYVQCCEE